MRPGGGCSDPGSAADPDVPNAPDALNTAGINVESVAFRLLRWQVTHDHGQLVTARRLLDDLLAKIRPAVHEAMRTCVRVNREVLEACRAQGVLEAPTVAP